MPKKKQKGTTKKGGSQKKPLEKRSQGDNGSNWGRGKKKKGKRGEERGGLEGRGKVTMRGIQKKKGREGGMYGGTRPVL